MPQVTYQGTITVVDTLDKAYQALDYLATKRVVGFDTETKPNFRKGQTNTVSLIQIATSDQAFLFRINLTGLFDKLLQFLENGNILKIGLSLKDDYHVLRKLAEFTPGGFVDIQDTVKKYGITDQSLQKIYAIIFGERISKAQRLSNWEASVLSPSQQIYAAIDAWACLHIHHYLNEGNFHPSESPWIITEPTQT